MAQRLIDVGKLLRGQPGEPGPDISVSLGMRRCKNLDSWKSLPENIWLSEGLVGLFVFFFSRAQSALFFVSILNSFQGDIEGQHLVVVMI